MWRLLHMVQEVHLHIHKDVYYAVTTPTNSNICTQVSYPMLMVYLHIADWRAITCHLNQ